MKNFFVIVISTGLLLAGCQSAPVAEKQTKQAEQKGQWEVSALSEQTIAKANAAVMDYRQCLAGETAVKAKERFDPRDIANTILKACEERLAPIKTAYDAENVPATLSERYMRKTRSQGAQMVLRSVMAVHAMRAADEEEAREAANQKKNKNKSNQRPSKREPG